MRDLPSGTVTGTPAEIDRQAAAVIDALAAGREPRPSMTRTIRGYQPTDGQEIDVLVVSRDEAATAFGNLDGRIGRHRPKWRRRSSRYC
jgi:hypothetical protein